MVRLLTLIFFLIFGISTAYCQDNTLQCDASSGLWQFDARSGLEGALCSTQYHPEHSNFYRIDFDQNSGQFAPAIPGSDETLHFLFASTDALFYADKTTVYALERDHFKVIWHKAWPDSTLLPVDPYDHDHYIILSTHDDQNELHLIRLSGKNIEEEMTATLSSRPLKIAWTPTRLIVAESTQMSIWTRETVAENADGTTNSESPKILPLGKTPKIVAIDPALTEGDFVLDQAGLMALNRAAKRLVYYRFESDSWTRASINATATIRALGSSPLYAMGVTIDANTVRIVARLGSVLQNRFEAKYWKLSQPEDATLVIGQNDVAALDGGADNRAQTIDTTELTWKRLALIDYPAPGRIADLAHDTLVTIHPDFEKSLILWDARTGKQLTSLPKDALNGAQIKTAKILNDLPRFITLRLDNDQFMLFDRQSGKYTQHHPYSPTSEWDDSPSSLRIVQNNLILPNNEAGSGWTIQQDNKKAAADQKDLGLGQLQPAQFEELQTPQEKWYGYCISENDCFIPSSTPGDQNRQQPQIVTENAQTTPHHPTGFAWILAMLSLFGMIGVMLWRHGFGKKSMIKQTKPDQEDIAVPTDIFDEKNRRFISDRDNRYFLAPSVVSKPVFRLGISILLGLIIALIVTVPYYYDDTFSTFFSWMVVLTLPVTAITWVAVSWRYWNRYYLLRFGCMTEGKWLNQAKPNQSIAYVPATGETYELSRMQWQRVDYVPMILFDPARTNFAIQYCGESSHTIVPLGEVQEHPKPACTFDIFRFFGVLAFLIMTFLGTQILYNMAFPNTLSTWKLNHIAENMEQYSTYTMACMDACSKLDTTCHNQCHHRQLSLVLKQNHGTSDNDVNMTPTEFLDTQRQIVAKARSILASDLSCQEKEARIEALSPWPDTLTTAFWQVYVDKPTFDAANLSSVYDELRKDTEYLRALCDSEGKCAQDSAKCNQPPTCPGSVSELKIRVCAFQNAIQLPN